MKFWPIAAAPTAHQQEACPLRRSLCCLMCLAGTHEQVEHRKHTSHPLVKPSALTRTAVATCTSLVFTPNS